jgi:hypothetical protein
LKGRKINIDHLKSFGCTCFVHVQPKDRDKFDPRSIKSVFLGYSSTQKGYKCYDVKNRKMFVSRDVRFDESNFFFQHTDNEPQGKHISDLFPTPISIDSVEVMAAPQQQVQIPAQNEEEHVNVEDDQEELVPIIPQPRRNPSRVRQPPPRLQEYETYVPRHPLGQTVFSNKVSSSHFVFLSKLSSEAEPRTFEEAN